MSNNHNHPEERRTDISQTLGRTRIAARDRILPTAPHNGGIRTSPKMPASNIAQDNRNWEDEEESDYMDMTPKNTPTRESPKLFRSKTEQTLRPRTPDHLNGSYHSLFEECDYADMRGKKSPNHFHSNLLTLPGRTSSSFHSLSAENSPIRNRSQTDRSPSPRGISLRQRSQTDGSPTITLSSPTMSFDLASSPRIKARSASSLQQRHDRKTTEFSYELDSPHRQSLSNSTSPSRKHLTLSLSPNRSPFKDPNSPFHEKSSPFHEKTALYLKGSFDKDDEDDYDVIPSMQRLAIQNSTKIKQSSGVEKKSTLQRPLPRVAQMTLPAHCKLTSPRTPAFSRSRAKSEKYPSTHDTNNNNTFGFATPPMKKRSHVLSSGGIQSQLFHAEKLVPYRDILPCTGTKTTAGRAAHNYLDQKEDCSKIKLQDRKSRSHSAHVGGSPSRMGGSGGVQTRINRLRQNHSFNQGSGAGVTDGVISFSSSSIRSDNSTKNVGVSESLHKNKTPVAPDRSVKSMERSKALPKAGLRRSQSFQSLVGKGGDGAQVMKCIANSKKNQSTDSDYLGWFTKTTPYSARKSSNTSTPDSHDNMSHAPTANLLSPETVDGKINSAAKVVDANAENNALLTKSPETVSNQAPHTSPSRTPGVAKKRKSFWRRKKGKSTQKEAEKEPSAKPRKSSAGEAKIKKSRKSWIFRHGRKKSSTSSLQNEIETVPQLNNNKNNAESSPQTVFSKQEVKATTVLLEDPHASHSNADIASNSSQLPTSKSPDKGCPMLSSSNFQQSLSVKPVTICKENKRYSHSLTSQSQIAEDQPISDERLSSSFTCDRVRTSSEYATKRLAKELTDESISITLHKSLCNVPSLDISLASNYDDDAFIDQVQPQPKKKLYDSIKSRSLGRIFAKKGVEKKSLESASGTSKSEDKLLSVTNFDLLLKVSDSSSLQAGKNTDFTTAAALENEEDISTVLEININTMAHGFVMQNSLDHPIKVSLLQNEKKKRRTSFGRKKDHPLSIYSTLKRLGSRSSELDDQDQQVSASSVLHSDGKSAFMNGEEEVDHFTANDCESNESLFDSEPAPLANARPIIRPIYQKPSSRALDVARLLLHCIKTTQPELICGYEEIEEDSHRFLLKTGDYQPDIDELLRRSYVKGHDLVTWTQELLRVKQKSEEKGDVRYKSSLTPTRRHIAGMWQVLFEEGAIFHVKCQDQFEDGGFYYGFHEEVTTPHLFPNSFAQSIEKNNTKFTYEEKEHVKAVETMTKLMPHWLDELGLSDAISYLQKHYHDAMFRKALRQQPEKRTTAELVMIYEEILHIKALAPLSDSVKRELAGVLKFEFHQEPGATLFRQGDEGTSWYIILHGSVRVDVLGKGIVCTLHEGDEFGNLALVNDAPRSATILAAEANCHFMTVDKVDFVRILKDVEANTVRLKEHDQDVLILEKIRSTSRAQYEKSDSTGDVDHEAGQTKQSYRYVVTAGTPQRILEHILEYIQPWRSSAYDEAMEDFILMHSVFMKTSEMFEHLLKNYRAEDALSVSFEMKRKIIYFVVRWSHIVGELREEDQDAYQFLQELMEEIDFDSVENPKYKELKTELTKMYNTKKRTDSESNNNDNTKSGSYLIVEESVKRYEAGRGLVELQRPIRGSDEVLLKVYNCEKEYATVKLPLSSSADEILQAVAEKMNKHTEEVVKLYEIQESGESIAIVRNRRSVVTSINLNSVLSVCDDKEDHCVSGLFQSTPPSRNFQFDEISSLEMAYHITQHDWNLVNNVHVIEYVHKVFGPKKFPTATPNLDVLTRRFNQLTYWPPTEICSCSNAHKRALVLRKFIKIAQHLKMYQNMFAFMALVIGIGNQAVCRLSATWEKLPAKYRKLMQEFETILDPSRNHRKYRVLASSLEPPFIPYFPLLMKDMTFQHEGNENQKQNLVNFEKMHMLSNSIKTIITGCSEKIDGDNLTTSNKTAEETRNYVKNLRVITDQKTLNELSAQIEPKR